MDLVIPPELEDLILCSCCHLPFNETDASPKLFSCRHHFCLKCVNSILLKGSELYCVHCWKRTELPGPDMKPENLPTYNAILYLSQNLSMLNLKPKPPDKQSSSNASTSSTSSSATVTTSSQQQQQQAGLQAGNNVKVSKKGENCITHAMPNALWCTKCNILLCRACAGSEEHRNHTIRTKTEAKNSIHEDIGSELATMQKILNEVQHLVLKQRDFLLKILESCTALKTQIETELINHIPTLEIAEMRESLSKAKICLDMLEQQSPAETYKLFSTLNIEKQRLQSKHQEIYLQCKLDDLIRHYGVLFDFDLIKQALATLHTNDTYSTINGIGHHNPILLLANYCISQLYSRHVLSTKHSQFMNSCNSSSYHHISNVPQPQQQQPPQQQQQPPPQQLLVGSNHQSPCEVVSTKTYADITTSSPKGNQAELNGMNVSTMALMQHQFQQQHSNHVQQKTQITGSVGGNSVAQNSSQSAATLICNPSVHVYPIFYFNIEMNGSPCGRILIEVRNDVAPKMAKNFSALSTGELGFGYKGCQIFQCWENESIITGDFELNNGRGGRSVFEESFFMPDDTKILAIRGSVGMRRSQKRHDNLGLVGSQFRIILREMRGFTGIFAFVIEGLELVEKISQTGDSAGKPQSNIVIASCGKLQ